MTYLVKEIFLTLQGEGFHTGRPAVFCRFTGCNLWTGREEHRARAKCRFCDTDFVGTDGHGGGKFATPKALADAVARAWEPRDATKALVVCTGGEPLLQLDSPAISALRARGFFVAVETNGSVLAPPGIDWLTVSPKAGVDLKVRRGDELKLVFPQVGLDPKDVEGLDFSHYYLQPMDGDRVSENTHHAIAYCLANPLWRLSVQTHKYLGIP